MTVTMKDIPAIISDLKKWKPSALAKDSDKPLSPKEAIMQLAPALMSKKEEGFTTAELVDFLAEHSLTVKPHNLTRYLREHIATTVKPQAIPDVSASELETEGSNAATSSEGCHQ